MPPLRYQFPKCLKKSACECFDELLTFDGRFSLHPDETIRLKNYIIKIKDQLEYYMYLVQLHEQKDVILLNPYVSQIRVNLLRTVLEHMQTTHYLLEKEDRLNKSLFVLVLNTKEIQLKTYIKCVEENIEYRLKSLNVFHNPDDYVPIGYFKNILESFIDLLYTLEQFKQFLVHGQCRKIMSKVGNVNNVLIKNII